MAGGKRLLCCVNGSAHAVRAVELACRLGPALGLGLTFLVVNHLRSASGFPPIRALQPEEAKEILDTAVRYARTHGIHDVGAEALEAADVAACVLDYARTRDIEHIVVGTGNPPFIGRLLIGSVSEAIVSGAHCPVTVAR
ncbi:universal stress protein [Aquibium carbonis]|uniref:Universal stress protein n=1 Tax=Aquibium carbonis TaxID=2495581 RepID=A0A429YTV9_9HYPH|nr:universal stress protein [Aquibium carbonis]RST84891.1 universal stress protein [Aquibium carbonis]